MEASTLSHAARRGLLTRKSPLLKLKGDEQLVALVRSGNSGAFDIIVDRYQARLLGFCRQMIGSTEDAEDVLQEVFVNAYKAMIADNREINLRPWLYRIAHNLVANYHRDHSRRQFVPLEVVNLPGQRRDEPEEVLEREEDHETLWEAIERLPAERRDLLIYKFGNRLSNLEIGDLMNKSEGAIKSLYFRTLAALRKELKGYTWGKDETDEAGE